MLRYYDGLRLLKPTARTGAGYREYSERDLLRLQQIQIGRALGLALEDIRKLMDDPKLDRRKLLARQRQALADKVQEATAMLRSVDAAIAWLDSTDDEEKTMNMKALFDGFDPAHYEQEAKQRWGETEAYAESARRMRKYSLDDKRQLKDEANKIFGEAATALRSNKEPTSRIATEIAERHRLYIDRWFYPCDFAMHAALADLYEADARFARNIDKYAEGLTPFFSAAIRTNAQRVR